MKVIFNNLKKTTFVLKYIIFLKWVRNYSKIQNLLEQNIFIKMTNDSENVHICVSVQKFTYLPLFTSVAPSLTNNSVNKKMRG